MTLGESSELWILGYDMSMQIHQLQQMCLWWKMLIMGETEQVGELGEFSALFALNLL